MADKTVVTVRTKLNKSDTNPVTTAVTYDWTGVTLDMLKGPAIDTLTINLQGGWRRNKKIPAMAEVKVTDLIARMGSRQGPVTVDSVKAQLSTLKPEEVNALIAQMKAEAEARAKSEKQSARKPAAKGDGDKSANA